MLRKVNYHILFCEIRYKVLNKFGRSVTSIAGRLFSFGGRIPLKFEK